MSIMVYDPQNGFLKASANAPAYDPNNFDDAYRLIPLGPDHKEIVDDTTHMDVPVYVKTGGNYKLSTSVERQDIAIAKYIPQNIYGSRVFVDKNIALPYEP